MDKVHVQIHYFVNNCSHKSHFFFFLLLGMPQLFIKTPTGKCVSVEVEPTDTVEHLKAILQEKEGIPPHQQILINNPDDNKLMEDGHTLSYYEVWKEEYIYLIFRLSGG